MNPEDNKDIEEIQNEQRKIISDFEESQRESQAEISKDIEEIRRDRFKDEKLETVKKEFIQWLQEIIDVFAEQTPEARTEIIKAIRGLSGCYEDKPLGDFFRKFAGGLEFYKDKFDALT